MNKFAAVILALTAFATVNAAHADARLAVLRCDQHIAMDAGTLVSIDQVFSQGNRHSQTVATVSAQSIAGPHVIATFNVIRKPVPAGIMGAPATYIGRGFTLTVNVDGTPVNGRHRSHLVVERPRAGRISEELLCSFVR